MIVGGVGMFHYSKLQYLFEFLYLKNYGERYTGERFVKYELGPVINEYKVQLLKLDELGILSVDRDALYRNAGVNKGSYITKRIEVGSRAQEFALTDERELKLLNGVIERFGNLSTDALKKVVYSTLPLKLNPKHNHEVLTDEVVEMIVDNPIVQGKQMAEEHLKKYPTINQEKRAEFIHEL